MAGEVQMMNSKSLVIKCLNLLLKVDSSLSDCQFSGVLRSNIKSVTEDIQELSTFTEKDSDEYGLAISVFHKCNDIESSSATDHIYVDICLELLAILQCIITKLARRDTANSCGLLSVAELNALLGSVQLIVGLGIIPCLSAGVGLSLNDRVKNPLPSYILNDRQQQSIVARKYRLLTCVRVILKQEYAYASIIAKHLIDILSSLLQIVCEPNHNNNTGDHTPPISIECMVKEGRELLHNLIISTYQPLVFREILILVGVSGIKNKRASDSTNIVPCPKWLHKVCGNIMRNRLMQNGGVFCLFQAMLDMFDDVNDLKHIDIIAKIIVHAPNPSATAQEEYFTCISNQILDILRDPHMVNAGVIKLCTSVIVLVTAINEILSNSLIWKPLYTPLQDCCSSESISLRDSGDIVASNASLSTCLTTLYKIFVIGMSPTTESCHVYLGNILQPIFVLWASLHSENVEDEIQQQVKQMILTYMTSVNVQTAACQLYNILVGNCKCNMLDSILFERRSSGDMCAIYGSDIPNMDIQSIIDSILTRHTLITNGIGKLILLWKDTGSYDVSISLFFKLLKHAASIDDDFICVKGLSAQQLIHLTSSTANSTISSNDRVLVSKWSVNLHVSSLLSSLIQLIPVEQLIQQDTASLLTFITIITTNSIKQIEKQPGEAVDFHILEMSLLLTCVICTHKLDDKERTLTNNLLEPINKLATLQSISSKESLAQIVDTAKILIATHGSGESMERLASVFDSWLASSSTTTAAQDVNDDLSPQASTSYASSPHMSEDKPRAKHSTKAVKFAEAWSNINDDLLPVKAAGCLAISKLIAHGDGQSMEKLPEILDLLLQCVSDEDSYLYLAAISALSTVADSQPQHILKPLIETYSGLCNRPDLSTDMQVRIKIGEVLVKVSKNLGHAVVKHRDTLVNLFLTTVSSSDVDMRVSSLSNLGEVCKHLRYSLGHHITEIVHCVLSLISSGECEVRRACVLLLHDILQGVDRDTILLIQHVIKDIYTALKLCYTRDTDHIVKLHAQLALQQLNTNMKDALIPTEQELVKKISVLDFF